MTGDLSRGPSLVIDRWRNTYVVPIDHPAPENLKARLDELVTRDLAGACERLLGSLLDTDDASVWLIRQLHLDLAADIAPGAETRLAQVWGEQFAAQLNQFLVQGGEDANVIRFPSRSAYLAHLAVDIARGQAWDKWYYQEFDSLRSLPAGRAICQAMVREHGQTSLILLLLSAQKRLDFVLNALSEHDAGRIYQSCFAGSEAGLEADERRWLPYLLESWRSIPFGTSVSMQVSSHDQLRLYAQARTLAPADSSDRGLQNAIDGLLALRSILYRLPSAPVVQSLVQAAALADRESVVRLLSLHGIEAPEGALRILIHGPGEPTNWGAQVVAILAPEKSPDVPAETSRWNDSFLTPFGGIFLLGPSFLELKIEEVIQAAAQTCKDSGQAAPLLRHLLAIRCMGRQHAIESLGDPGLQAFACTDRGYWPPDVADLIATANADAIFWALATVLAEDQRISSSVWLADLVAIPFSNCEAVFLRDAENDEWLHAIVFDGSIGNAEAALDQGLQSVLHIVGEKPRWLVLSTRLSESCTAQSFLEHVGGTVRLNTMENSAFEEIALELGVQTARLKRAVRPVDADLEFLSLAGLWSGFQLPPAGELAWSFVARAIWRNFSRKLTGFSAGSPEYMFRNFLAGLSSVRSSPAKLDVQLPASPLAMILRLAGAYGHSYALPWFPEREICLLAPPD